MSNEVNGVASSNGTSPIQNGFSLQSSSSSFLTKAQQAALDAALEKKDKAASLAAAKRPAGVSRAVRKHGTVHVKHTQGTVGDRKNKSLRPGETKKKGAGGKFTWGDLLDEAARPATGAALDPNDPNYDSEDDPCRRAADAEAARSAIAADGYGTPVTTSVAGEASEAGEEDPGATSSGIVRAVNKLKEDIREMLLEYLESQDMAEAGACIAELQLPQYDYYIVKRALTVAADRKDRDREAISGLLSHLYGQYVSPQQMQKGFVEVLEDFDDWLLDVPDGVTVMSLFICRAITDEILPPSFVSRILPPAGSSLAQLKEKCAATMAQPHSAERLLRCWGGDATLTLAEARQRIKAMLKEYCNSRDVAEVERQLRALSAPFFHHEVVKQALLMSAEDMSNTKESMLTLLSALAAAGDVSSAQVAKGFHRLVDQLDDLALDMPDLQTSFHTLCADSVAAGFLDEADATALAEAERAGPHANLSPATAAAHSTHAFKKMAVAAVREFCDSEDFDEVARILSERQEDAGLLHLFVKALLQVVMERSFRERELASLLLVNLSPVPLSPEQMEAGFTRMLVGIDDYILDVPDAAHLMTQFTARAVVDELLPPAFLARALDAMLPDSMGVAVVRNTGRLLRQPHAAERILQCWHGGLRTVARLKSSMHAMVKEYLANPDSPASLREAHQSLRELSVPHFHHEYIKQILSAAFDHAPQVTALANLLQYHSTSGDISATQMSSGFQRVHANLADYTLDCPSAKTIFSDLCDRGYKAGWLETGAINFPSAPPAPDAA